jgi:hypothetical protein
VRDQPVPAILVAWHAPRSGFRSPPPVRSRHVASGQPNWRFAAIDSAVAEATVLLRHMSIGIMSSFEPRSVCTKGCDFGGSDQNHTA